MSVEDSAAGIWISFHIRDEEYVAFLAASALRLRFNAAGTSPRALQRAYKANQALIDAVARRQFLNGAARPLRLTAENFSDPARTPEKTTRPASSRK